MITYIILLLFIIAIAIFAYKLFDKEIIGPTFVTASIFGMGVLFSIIGLRSWNRVDNLNIKTIAIILIGIIMFLLGELLARKTKKNKENKIENLIKSKYKEKSKVNLIVIIACLIITIITTILLFLEIRKICEHYGFVSNDISKLLGFYRTKTELFSTNLLKDNISINFIVKQMKKVCEAINIIFAYLLIKKIVDKRIKENIAETVLLIVTIILGLIQTFLNSGGRSILMHFLVAYIMLYLLLKLRNDRISLKTIKRLIIIIICIFILFYAILPLLGRNSNVNFIDYITFYLGSPIPSLNTFCEANKGINPQFGSETFSSVYYVLNKFHIIDYKKALTSEWVNFVPKLSSNVYTSLRAYYYDFGFIGLAILQFLFGFLVTKFYLVVKQSNISLYKIIYAYFFYILIDQIRAEQFYSLINTSILALLIIFILLYRIILCEKIKKENDDETK